MTYTSKKLPKYMFRFACILALVSMSCFCAYTQNPPASAGALVSKTNTAATPSYEGIYVVITSQTDNAMLQEIENKLKKAGIYFKATEVNFTNGLLTNITLAVDIPGVYKATSSYGKEKEPLPASVIFYHEASKGAGLSGGIPEALSERGKLVVTNNLKGVLILYDADNMECSGTVHTNWKSK
jgi:hypothetical protein